MILLYFTNSRAQRIKNTLIWDMPSKQFGYFPFFISYLH